MSRVLFVFLIAIHHHSVLAFSGQPAIVRTGVLLRAFSTMSAECSFMNSKTPSSSSSIVSLFESIRKKKGKEIPLDQFKITGSARPVLKKIKAKLYDTGEWPHVDPTPGTAGFCQLIAGFMAKQIQTLNAIDLDHSSEEETRALLPSVKAFLLQERYDPRYYQPLTPKLIAHKRESELELIAADRHLSSSQAALLVRSTQASFVEDLFSFTKTSHDTPIEESMRIAIDMIHASDCYIFTR